MLDNTITLAIGDPAVNTAYTRDETLVNRSLFVGPANSSILRDQMNIYRTKPKKSGNFAGVMKSEVKFTEDFIVPGVDTTTSQAAPFILDISASIPVGVSNEDIQAGLDRAIAFLSNASAMRLFASQEY